MDTSSAAALTLVGGYLALDFVNTAGGWVRGPFFDNLQEPSDLLDWAAHAGAIETGAAARLARDVDAGAGALLLDKARTLRGAIYRTGAALAKGDDPERADLAALRDAGSSALAQSRLVRHGGGFRPDFSGTSAEAALLGPIALSALDMLETGNFDRLKQCPGEDCGWLFFDRSKNNSRRWCDMATCGNRDKGRRHRARS